jgi:hypothetical protein
MDMVDTMIDDAMIDDAVIDDAMVRRGTGSLPRWRPLPKELTSHRRVP